MTRRRWIADQVSGNQAILTGRNAEHLSRVLRARLGQQFEVATPQGVRLGEIVGIEAGRVVFSLQQDHAAQAQNPTFRVNLYLAVFKFDRFEWAIEKSTELGVSTIVPVIAARTDSHLAGAAGKRVERWRRIAHEASQQSRRDSVPEIRDPVKLDKIVGLAPEKRVVLSEVERTQNLADLLSDASEFSVAIGPEGGWTGPELDQFTQKGWLSSSLGPAILRAETAAIAAMVLCQAAAQKSTP